MTFNNSEYNALKTEQIHHDRTCLTILRFLITASTAVYGLVGVRNSYSFFLKLLSLVWFIGFLYIAEKRSAIKRISYYIQTEIESKNSAEFAWEKWLYKNREGIVTTFDSEYVKLNFPKITPLKIELTLLILTCVFNFAWFCLLNESTINLTNLNSKVVTDIILLIIISIIFIVFIVYSTWIVWQYDRFNNLVLKSLNNENNNS